MAASPEPEFSRRYDLTEITAGLDQQTIEANAAERADLTKRLDLEKMDAFCATVTLTPWREHGFRVKGWFRATVWQICVVTLDPFEQEIEGEIDRTFLTTADAPKTGREISVSMEEDDPDILDIDYIDVGEIATETLILELPVYPRKPGVEFSDPGKEGLATESQRENPFEILKTLRTDRNIS